MGNNNGEDMITIITIVVLSIMFLRPKLTNTLKKKLKEDRQKFYNAISSILSEELDSEETMEQIHVTFKNLCKNNPNLRKKYKNTVDFCEDILSSIRTQNSTWFGSFFETEYNDEHASKLNSIIQIMRSRQIFSMVSLKYENRLTTIKDAFTTNNNDLGINNLKHLADDIKELENTVDVQKKRSKLAIAISIIGIIVTVLSKYVWQ